MKTVGANLTGVSVGTYKCEQRVFSIAVFILALRSAAFLMAGEEARQPVSYGVKAAGGDAQFGFIHSIKRFISIVFTRVCGVLVFPRVSGQLATRNASNSS